MSKEKTRYFVYRNLHFKNVTWSLKSTKTKKVEKRLENVFLSFAEFKVSQAGRSRVLKEGVKNVHAGVVGFLLKSRPRVKKWIKARYNPYELDSFCDENGQRIEKARYAHLCKDGLFVAY